MTTLNTHDPPGLCVAALRRAFPRTRFTGPRWADVASARLTYLEPGAPGVYHPFASRYFAKLPGVYPHGAVAKKKTVARLSESLRSVREMAESTECSTCNRTRGRRGTATGRCAAAFRRRRRSPRTSLAAGGRLDDSAANQRARSHCLHASHWIVIFEGVGRRRRTRQRRRRRALCVQRREKGAIHIPKTREIVECARAHQRVHGKGELGVGSYRQRRYRR